MSTEEQKNKYCDVTPHGEVEKVLDNVFIVRGSFNVMPFMRIPRTMCIVRRGKSLTIFNSIRVNETVEAQIKELGSIDHLVRMAWGHGIDDQYYIDTFQPKFWSIDVKPMTTSKADEILSVTNHPIEDAKVYMMQNIKEQEAVFWIPDSGGTLIACDALQNSTDSCHTSFLGNIVGRAMGFMTPCTCVPMYRRTAPANKAEDLYPNFEKLLEWEWDNLVTGHGPAKVGGAHAAVQEQVEKIWEKK